MTEDMALGILFGVALGLSLALLVKIQNKNRGE